MSIIGLLVLLLIAAICGSIGQALAGYSRGGCLMSIIVGFIGAYLGMWLSSQLGLPEMLAINIEGEMFPVVWAIIGSALFTAVLGLFARR
ncbi:MAG: hypothetical protein KJ069_06355 [Anaerolineae bacterium]|nr:hypothetical protein [Anaerolineae bacterium]